MKNNYLKDVCKLNKFKQVDSKTINSLICDNGDIALLPSSKDYDLFTTYDMAKKYICAGEVFTLGRARYANIKYCNGKFISSNNIIVQSSNEKLVLTKFLYYYCKFNSKKFYRDGTTYPVFDEDSFNSSTINIPPIIEQLKIIKLLDKLYLICEQLDKNMMLCDQIIKSKFLEFFGDPIVNDKNLPLTTYGALFEMNAGGTPSKSNKEYWTNGTISWIGSNMCQNKVIYKNDDKYITESGLKHSSAKIFPVDTVLVALVGATIGKTALLKFETSTNQNILGIRKIVESGYEPIFVFYHLQFLYDKFINIGDGGFSMASKDFVSKLPIYKLSIEKQRKFSKFVLKINQISYILENQKKLMNDEIEKIMINNFGE